MKRKEAEERAIAQAKEAEVTIDMKERWGDAVEDYPPVMVNVLWVSVKHIAVEWIDRELPEAWFRPMFTEGS